MLACATSWVSGKNSPQNVNHGLGRHDVIELFSKVLKRFTKRQVHLTDGKGKRLAFSRLEVARCEAKCLADGVDLG